MNRKNIFPFVVLVLVLTFSTSVLASHEEEEETDGCLSNIGACIMEKLAEFFLKILNAPLEPLVDLIKSLLENPVDISIFASVWKIITYAISFFYVLFLIYNGLLFITSSNSAEKRYKAKEALQNTIVMIVLIQASYLLYDVVVKIVAGFTSGMLSLVNTDFFLLTPDGSIFLQIFFFLPYALLLLVTALLLAFRYLLVAGGIILLPIGILLYFFQPARSYGSFILHFLGGQVFLSIVIALVFLMGSKLIGLPVFSTLKIIVVMASFVLADLLVILMLIFSVIKAASSFKAITQVFR